MDADLTALNDLIAQVRPSLHRYCARMVGSAFDGEDVVQEALAHAAAAYHAGIEKPQSWLFRVAHNAALDALRKRKRLSAFESDVDTAFVPDDNAAADARVSVTASLAALQTLTPVERACVVLLDVLGHSLAETAEVLGVSVPAVKAALHRGRGRLAQVRADAPVPSQISADERARLRAYADRFNARDFDALRDLLADDVRLDLANRVKLAGKKDVSIYFARYSERAPFHISLGLAEGLPVLRFAETTAPEQTLFVVRLDWKDGRIASIRDFHYARYVMDSLSISSLA